MNCNDPSNQNQCPNPGGNTTQTEIQNNWNNLIDSLDKPVGNINPPMLLIGIIGILTIKKLMP